MLWNIIIILWWIGLAISFLVSCGMSAFAILVPETPMGVRVGAVMGIWLRWIGGIISGVIGLLILGFVLSLLGVPVRGFTFVPR